MAQGDLNVANQSGAAFRADLNNQLQALGTLQSGASEPSTTFAYMLWADTTAALLKQRNAANNAWVTIGTLGTANLGLLAASGGTLTGPLLAAAGSAAAPGVALAGDADTGFYSKAANEIGVAAGGALTAWFGTDGINLAGQDDVRFWDADSSNYVGLQAPATVTSNLTWTLPATDGTSGQALRTNGSGVLSWALPGKIIKAQSFYDAGSSTTSTSFVNANFANFVFTPLSASSTLLLFFSFQAQQSLVVGANNTSYHSIYEGTTQVGSGFTTAAANASGGLQIQSMGCIQASLVNSSTSARSFRMYHATANSSGAASTTAIYATIMEVAN